MPDDERRSDRCPTCGVAGEAMPQAVRGNHGAKLYRCPACTLQFLDVWSCPRLVNSFYEAQEVVYHSDIQPGAIKINEYDRRLEDLKPYLGHDKRLLEIGAGQGLFLDRVALHVGAAHAVEVSPAHVSLLREKGFDVWDGDLTALDPPAPYDVVCMFAVFEHLPNVLDYIGQLRRWLHADSVVFIETPNVMDPLVSFYDIPAYRDFFYRDYHLYNFNDRSMHALLEKAGYSCETRPLQVASITNHFHWLHTGTKQESMNRMVNVTLPQPLLGTTPTGEDFMHLLDRTDDYYRKVLEEAGVGDILVTVARLDRSG